MSQEEIKPTETTPATEEKYPLTPEEEAQLIKWLEDVKFAGFSRFKFLNDHKQIHLESSAPDADGDFIWWEYAEKARQNDWTYEQMQEYIESLK